MTESEAGRRTRVSNSAWARSPCRCRGTSALQTPGCWQSRRGLSAISGGWRPRSRGWLVRRLARTVVFSCSYDGERSPTWVARRWLKLRFRRCREKAEPRVRVRVGRLASRDVAVVVHDTQSVGVYRQGSDLKYNGTVHQFKMWTLERVVRCRVGEPRVAVLAGPEEGWRVLPPGIVPGHDVARCGGT